MQHIYHEVHYRHIQEDLFYSLKTHFILILCKKCIPPIEIKRCFREGVKVKIQKKMVILPKTRVGRRIWNRKCGNNQSFLFSISTPFSLQQTSQFKIELESTLTRTQLICSKQCSKWFGCEIAWQVSWEIF